MDRINVLLENSKRAVRYWWLLAVVGIALLAAGILIFAYPSRSYLAMATLFGWLMFLSGMLEAALSAMNRHFVTGRGWMAVGGLIEIILGLILIFNVSLSEITLPIVLGFWLLMRAFATIGLGGDMNALEIPGAGWTVFTGILLLLCAVWILLQPLVFGRTAVLVWVSISLLFAGTGACSLAFQLRCSHPNDGGREHRPPHPAARLKTCEAAAGNPAAASRTPCRPKPAPNNEGDLAAPFSHQKLTLKNIPFSENFREVMVQITQIRITLYYLPHDQVFVLGDAVV